MIRRLKEILGGVSWAFRFSNPCEILLTRHFFRRKRSVIIGHGGLQMLIDSQTCDAQVGAHLQAIGFQQATETPGDGETWLTLWQNPQAPPPAGSSNYTGGARE